LIGPSKALVQVEDTVVPPIDACAVLEMSLVNPVWVRARIVNVAVPFTARFISLSIPAALAVTESGLPSVVCDPTPTYVTCQLQFTTPDGSASTTRTPVAKLGPRFVTTT